jgi:alpha/beta superfamily hydrolase
VAVEVAGPAGSLETLLEAPAGASGSAFAVVCHPHPQHGGTLHNKVVHSVARALQEQGMATLRFNYRGVGASSGSYDEGRGEADDACAVIAWGRRRWPGAKLTLAGFSFGAGVALRIAATARPSRLITIAPAIDRLPLSSLPRPDCPWLLVMGEADDVVDPVRVRAWADGFDPPPQQIWLPGVGHFFHGALTALKEAVQAP